MDAEEVRMAYPGEPGRERCEREFEETQVNQGEPSAWVGFAWANQGEPGVGEGGLGAMGRMGRQCRPLIGSLWIIGCLRACGMTAAMTAVSNAHADMHI